MTRRFLLVVNDSRPEFLQHAREFAVLLTAAGVELQVPEEEYDALADAVPGLVAAPSDALSTGCELGLVLGGDGTILRVADLTRGSGLPLLGVNFGHVGFLAEAERAELADVAAQLVSGDYRVEQRLALHVVARHGDEILATNWALNEITVERAERERMLEVLIELDGRPLTSFGCDGVIAATPTGSTAYAFSAGGPIVWPDVDALCIVPISAHALFARPVVVGPDTKVAFELLRFREGGGSLRCDGARVTDLPPTSRVEVCRSDVPVPLVRLSDRPFTDRLVAKFHLPVQGWRGDHP